MNTETRLWLIRHAPVDAPEGIIHGPNAPADLRDTEAFGVLKARLPVDAAVFCSPARRTIETAKALGLDPVIQPAFREQDFGEWTGRRHNDLAAELGDIYRSFWKSPALNAPPLGESFAHQIERARIGLAELPTGDIILVVHSGTIRALLAIALDIAPEAALRFVIDPLSLTRVDHLEGSWRVNQVNYKCE